LCVANPSLKGAAFPGTPPNWTYCQGSPDINPSLSSYPASNGSSYLGLGANGSELDVEIAQATLCGPLNVGEPNAFALDLSMSAAFGPFGSAMLQVRGASTSCAKEELLWTSPTLTVFDTWKTYCGSLRPAKAYPYLMVVPVAPPSSNPGAAVGGYVIVDNFGSGACQSP
jgi:hypothetical protein